MENKTNNKKLTEKEFIKNIYNAFKRYKNKIIDLTKLNYEINVGLDLDKEQILKARDIVDMLKKELEQEQIKNKEKNNKISKLENELIKTKKHLNEQNKNICMNNDNLSQFFKDVSYTLTNEEKNEIKTNYTSKYIKYF